MMLLEAVELYVEGLVTSTELLALKHDDQPARAITLWGIRREQKKTGA